MGASPSTTLAGGLRQVERISDHLARRYQPAAAAVASTSGVAQRMLRRQPCPCHVRRTCGRHPGSLDGDLPTGRSTGRFHQQIKPLLLRAR